MKRTTEITFEIEETVVLRPDKMLMAFCPLCGESAVMVSPQVIAVLTSLSEREIFRLVEAGKLHFIETDHILICLNSIRFLEGVVKK